MIKPGDFVVFGIEDTALHGTALGELYKFCNTRHRICSGVKNDSDKIVHLLYTKPRCYNENSPMCNDDVTSCQGHMTIH